MGVTKSQTECVFKVNWKASRRGARTIALRGDPTLNDLQEAIFAAFDRFDTRLDSFYFPKAPSRRRTAGPRPKEYTAPQMFAEPDTFDAESRLDASATRLDDLHLRPGHKFEYLFDFGDCQWHDGAVEAVNPSAPRARYGQIRASRGSSPPQYEAVDE